MNLKQIYKDKTNKDPLDYPLEQFPRVTVDYVNWLELQLTTRVESSNQLLDRYNEWLNTAELTNVSLDASNTREFLNL